MKHLQNGNIDKEYSMEGLNAILKLSLLQHSIKLNKPFLHEDYGNTHKLNY